MSDLVLQIIAIRLGALVVAGLLLQTLPEQRSTTACAPLVSTDRHASLQDAATRADHTLRD